MILFQCIYVLFCVSLAGVNAYLIINGKRIYHALNGLVHLIIAGVSIYIYGWYGVICLFIARVFFDWSLNLFRGLPLGYVPLNPKSYVDRFEKWVFGPNGILPKIIYIIVIIGLNMFHA